MKFLSEFLKPQKSDALINGRFCLGKKTSAGLGRTSVTDRARIEVYTKNSDQMIVAAVADGHLGEPHGETAEIAVNTFFDTIKNSVQKEPVELIEEAFQAANIAVYSRNLSMDEPGFCTLTAALITKKRVFVGNIGNGRVYLIQANNKLQQITLDHVYGNLKGGNIEGKDAFKLAHVLGRKEKVGVDTGFYFEGRTTDPKTAFRLGWAGLPLHDGDTVLLCTDGLVSLTNEGIRYASDKELVEAIQTEYAPSAAVKMVGYAEGRKINENVSAIIIQRLTDDRISQMQYQVQATKRASKARSVVSGVAVLVLLIGVVMSMRALFRSNNLIDRTRLATPLVIEITNTPLSSFTPTAILELGRSRVEDICGKEIPSVIDTNGSTNILRQGEYLNDNSLIQSSDGYVKLVARDNQNSIDEVYLLPVSVVRIISIIEMQFSLIEGGIAVEPGSGIAFVHLPGFGGSIARVLNGRVLVRIVDEVKVQILCLKGECEFQIPAQTDTWQSVPEGEKRTYNLLTGELLKSKPISEEDLLIAAFNCTLLNIDTPNYDPALLSSTPTIINQPILQATNTPPKDKPTKTLSPSHTPTPTPTPTPCPGNSCKKK